MATNIVVPELGESVVEARVARWLKKEGEAVAVGDALVELETEKIDLEVSADRAGVLGHIRHGEGADVKVGEVLAVLEPGAGASATSTTAAAPAAEVKATPTARNVAREAGLALESVAASGTGGRVMKQDVLRARPGTDAAPAAKPGALPPPSAPSPSAPGAPGAGHRLQQGGLRSDLAGAPSGGVRASGDRREERVRMSKRRATIARRLVEAQHHAAMLTTFNEADMTAVMKLRQRRKEAFQAQYGVGLGIASFFVKAAIGALKAFPHLNAEIQGDEILLKHYYDIGMAVGAEGGLVVPVLRDADQKSFAEIEVAIRDYAKRAQDGTLTLEDLKGGTFTITNGGVFGSLMSTPILNPPQVGILGLHKIADRPVAIDGQVVIRPMMYLALSYDHRIVDGREAVQFLVKIKDLIEDPALMVLA
jgi:2-oxoglutarate dehydrogenase E2 component (dihydrolipoamide succinyltransferase)